MPKTTVLTDGSFDFSGGVDSSLVTTIRSAVNPHGLRRDQLAWLNNATVRGGGITQRTGIVFKPGSIKLPSGIWQGGFIYDPFTQNPWLICGISGQVYKVLLDSPYTVTNLSQVYGAAFPANTDQWFFEQGEEFLVIQCGDGTTLPLFYVGTPGKESLRHSNGIIGAGNPGNELPAAYMMKYYGQRMWYAQGLVYCAGDLVGGPSGTAAYGERDSILKVTENPLASGGDGFRLPTTAGTIRALVYAANLDTSLGQGPLYIVTRKQIYALTVPVSRADWIAANSTNQPRQTVVQQNNGGVSDRGFVAVNGDLFYQSLDPAIRSFILAVKYFGQWGNKPISNNILRALQFNDRSLMRFSSGIYFDNRLLELILPQKNVNGVTHQAIAVLDFDIISSFLESERQQPSWEGVYDGLDYLQLFAGDFGGRERAFTAISAREDQSIQIWEITNSSRSDYTADVGNDEHRVNWTVETPAFTFNAEFELKELTTAEIWFDKVFGQVLVDVDFRPDADPCWHFWYHGKLCATRVCAEDVNNPACYPPPQYREGWKWTMKLPAPPDECGSGIKTGGSRPTTQGFQFQVRIRLKGWCRIRGIVLYASLREREVFEGLDCQ